MKPILNLNNFKGTRKVHMKNQQTHNFAVIILCVKATWNCNSPFRNKMTPAQNLIQSSYGRFFVPFHRNTGALIQMKLFYCCFVHARAGYTLIESVIGLLEIKFWPHKVCFRAVLDVISFIHRQKMDTLILIYCFLFVLCMRGGKL